METAIILIHCPDQRGIVAKISGFLFSHNVNIIQADQHSTDPENGRFFLRIEFCFDTTVVKKTEFEKDFEVVAGGFEAEWEIWYKNTPVKMGILVSGQDHCLFDLLYRCTSGDLSVQIPFVISNHENLRPLVEKFNAPFFHIPVPKNDKKKSEKELLKIVKGTTDFLVLARYMQVLSPEFLHEYRMPIINIHHSFLPSFKGANPYAQAYDRGVKIIGATAHYVTKTLDEGPIIE
ncbi:MAG: formyltetrahydrofolate deformylase, partial [Nitrospinota bacterium]